MIIYICVPLFGIGGIGEATISLALATEFAKFDITIT